MATMKNHTIGWNIDDPLQLEGHKWCEKLKTTGQLSKYVRDLILRDLHKKNDSVPVQASGVKLQQSARPLINNRQA